MSALLRVEQAEPDRVGAAAFVLSLRARGVSDLAQLRAMETVPRELFAPRRYLDLARSDVALPLACGEAMTAPGSVAAMLAALGVRPGHRVLEIGSGSGYVSALLARMGALVHSLERHPVLADSARSRLAAAGVTGVTVACGDGLVAPPESRFDRILLNGAIASLNPAVLGRLAEGGRLVGAHAAGRSAAPPRLLVLDRRDGGGLAHRLGTPLRISPLFDASAASDGAARNGSLT